jgi:hypothetical protein
MRVFLYSEQMFTVQKVYSGFSTRCNVWGRDAADPTAYAHLLGQVIEAFGADQVLGGTDSIRYRTSQGQIDAFRRLESPEVLVENTGTRRSRGR